MTMCPQYDEQALVPLSQLGWHRATLSRMSSCAAVRAGIATNAPLHLLPIIIVLDSLGVALHETGHRALDASGPGGSSRLGAGEVPAELRAFHSIQEKFPLDITILPNRLTGIKWEAAVGRCLLQNVGLVCAELFTPAIDGTLEYDLGLVE